MAKLKITETVLRDAHQSLLATRMSLDDMRPILPEIDKIIEENLKGWKKNRISKISLAILRIAVFEMLYIDNRELPVSVSINEAVELTKSYSTDKDASFVNGVLGAASRTLEKSGES